MLKPRIAITMGDPAGVGPEIILKAIQPELFATCVPIVIGDVKMLQRAAQWVHVQLPIVPIKTLADIGSEQAIYCYDMPCVPDDLPVGTVQKEAGHAAYLFLEKAIQLAQAKEIAAICTAPLNKEALHLAGHHYPGHTEILAHLTGVEDYAMLLSSPTLNVIHVTTHIGLIDAIQQITVERVAKVIKLAHDAMKKAGIAQPRIGVCAINPHAGENGLFGYGEEEEKINPAVRQMQQLGLHVEGALPADTLFYRATRGDFDIVVAMYHDQGHGPIKVLGIDAGVNITVGLPIIRTSVDHGTAFDIAGTGKAEEKSLLEAIRQAVQFSQA